jgi:hypothetical protein
MSLVTLVNGYGGKKLAYRNTGVTVRQYMVLSVPGFFLYIFFRHARLLLGWMKWNAKRKLLLAERVLRIRIRRIRIFLGLPIRTRIPIRIRIGLWILSSSSKESKKNLDFYCFLTSLWLFTSVPDPNVFEPPGSEFGSVRQMYGSESGSVRQMYGSEDPDPRIRIRTTMSRIHNTDTNRPCLWM